MCSEKAAQDDLLAQRRKGIGDRRVQLLKNAVGKAREAAHRHIDEAGAGEGLGEPILGQINKNELTDILIIVVRYYGGVNLGTSGLIVAYRTAAAEAIANAEIVSQFVEEEVVFDFPYIMMNDVMKIIKDMSPRIISQTYDNTCEMKLSIRKSEAPMLKAKFDKLAFKDD